MKNNTIFLLFIFSFCFGFHQKMNAQDDSEIKDISGRVVDADNNPLSNVKVIALLSKDEVLTNENGGFNIKIISGQSNFLRFKKEGYQTSSMFVENNIDEPVQLVNVPYLYGTNQLEIPYLQLKPKNNISSINTITGDELRSFPSIQFLEALQGRLPGLVMSQDDYTPGAEWVTGSIRGEAAVYYIDGIQRNPKDLTVYEIDKVEVIKDLSGRAALGISGASPVVWITTKKGKENVNEINITAETGISEAVALPNYLDAYNYTTLYNEALENDGLSAFYSQEDLEAYQSGNSTLRHPNINYYDKYVKDYSRFTRANVDFQGGNKKLTYFSNINYVGSGGYEDVGQETTYNRYKIRGNVDIKLNDFMKMNVNLSGTYGRAEYPNAEGGAGRFNMFDILSTYPSNATPVWHDDKLIISDNYPLNLTNELVYGGYAESTELNTQNLVSLLVDLDNITKGLEFYASAALDANNVLVNNKGGTAALYRRVGDNDALERVVEQVVEPSMQNGNDYYDRRLTGMANLSYEYADDYNELNMDLSYYHALQEERITISNYQPNRIQDLAFRANYVFDKKYVVQFDGSYTGNMRLKEGERFNFYPTVGAAWNVSEESFLKNSSFINYLKLYSSYGVMGVNNFNIPGNYNSYYLYQTLWQNTGTWTTGIEGQKSGADNIYNVLQYASSSFSLPERRYFNIGLKTEILDRKIALETNYFNQNDVDILSVKSNFTPSLYGTGGFLPVQNFGETRKYGVDGMIQYNDEFGDFKVSLGLNTQYLRSKNVVVDEPVALANYRKQAGKDADAFIGYKALGLYQSQEEIDSRGVTQSWGTLAPGDIKYEDYNDDGVINEQDMHYFGGHVPRISYGINISLAYKGFDLYVLANGRANGKVMLNNSYFQNNSTTDNYSEVMLDRWPVTNTMPRLTTISQNNYQDSSFWLEDGTYLNLRNVQLGYTFPSALSRKLNMQQLRLYVRGRNIASFSKIHKKYGLNAENLSSGISMYPISRTVTFGLSTKF